MKKMVLFLSLLVAVLFITSCKPEFTYEDTADGVILTGYNRSKREVIIPAEYNGRPITAIGRNAFSEKKLRSITIPDSVTTIGFGAFSENQLSAVIIPDSVTTIGEYAFLLNELTSVVISNSVTTIGTGAFSKNQLSAVIIPDSVTTIGQGAFRDNELTAIAIPESVTTIEQGAFENNRLTAIAIPDSVTTIEAGAFTNNNLTTITIGGNMSLNSIVATFGHGFEGVYRQWSMRAGTYTRTGSTWETDVPANDESDFDIRQNAQGGITITRYKGAATEVVIPRTIEGIRVTEIGQQAFSPFYNILMGHNQGILTSVIIPDTVTSIGLMAFAANELTSVTIPSSVTSIGAMAFDSNPMTSVTLPGNINFSAFDLSPFPNNLADFYTGEGRRAGTYTWSGRLWSR